MSTQNKRCSENGILLVRMKKNEGAQAITELMRAQMYSQPTEVREMSRLDGEMSNILKQTSLPDDVKAWLYAQKLQRFLNFQDQLHGSWPYSRNLIPAEGSTQEQVTSPNDNQLPTPVLDQQAWGNMITPAKQMAEGDGSNSVPPATSLPSQSLKRRRTQPPRKRRKPNWFNYIDASPNDKGYYARKRERIPKGGPKLTLIQKWPEKYEEYINIP